MIEGIELCDGAKTIIETVEKLQLNVDEAVTNNPETPAVDVVKTLRDKIVEDLRYFVFDREGIHEDDHEWSYQNYDDPISNTVLRIADALECIKVQD